MFAPATDSFAPAAVRGSPHTGSEEHWWEHTGRAGSERGWGRQTEAVFVRVWEYEVRPERRDAFVQAYGPDGDWARLFARHPGWGSTDLYVSTADRNRFVTVDRWVDEASWAAFLAEWAEDYHALDDQLAPLTVSERDLLAE